MTILITNTMLANSGKHGVIKPDQHGYRSIVLGGFGIYNESGIYYDEKSAITAITTDSVLKRKLEKGMLGGEADHPDVSGMDDAAALARMFEIKVKYKSHNIRSIRIVTDKYRDASGRYITIIEGDVAPSNNQYGADLERDFNDPFQNTAFSIRSVLDTVRSTIYKRFLKIPITWDRVTEPGIKFANKYFSYACECYRPLEVSGFSCRDEVLNEIINNIGKHGGTEDYNEIVYLLQKSLSSNIILPSFLK